MQWISDLVRERILWGALIISSLSAGLVAGYGRERHQGRSPDRSWWLTRFYIMPFLAIVVVMLVDQFKLNGSKTAFAASMLAMMAYEIVGMLYTKGLKASGDALDAIGGTIGAAARPYHSLIDTDAAGRPAAHIAITDAEKPVAGGVGQSLRDVFPAETSDALKPLLDTLNDMDDLPGVG